MKKRGLAVILAVILVCSLTGCMNMNLEEKITKDGKVKDTVVLYLEKAAVVDYINRKVGSDRVAEFEKDWKKQGYTMQNIEGRDYYVTKPDTDSSTIAKTIKNNQKEMLKGSYQLWETGMRVDLKLVLDTLGLGELSGAGLGEAWELNDKELKEILAKSYINYSVVFDYDIVKTDKNGMIDSQNPKKATWKFMLSDIDKLPALEAYCKSDIKVSGVRQGATYKKAKKVKFSGVKSATYKGKKVKSGKTFKKHGQHTLILKAASGEQRTVSFFIDKKKPEIIGIKNKKTYKAAKYFMVTDKGSGVASVKVNGKKVKLDSFDGYELRKNGTYKIVVKDGVGNVKKIKVKIKKKK